MSAYDNKILIIGIGNCGRADDGLGWAFIDQIKDGLPKNFDYEYRYHLQVEDAELISHYAEVYFIDADINQWSQGFNLRTCQPKAIHNFSTHELAPEAVLHLTRMVYNKLPKAYILGISGVNFPLETGLSNEAEDNLAHALNFFNEKILNLVI